MMVANALWNYVFFRARDLYAGFVSGSLAPILDLALYFTRKHHCLQDVGWLADYRLGFQVFFQPENSAFPTNSRLFEPAEGSERIVAYCID